MNCWNSKGNFAEFVIFARCRKIDFWTSSEGPVNWHVSNAVSATVFGFI